MVSLTGFVVTVTVLGVQQATGIFSPRYMRLWYRDGRLKLVLAELVGTLLFSFAVIRRIQPDAVPDISVSLAGLGLSVGLLLFLLYFDRFLHRMRPVAVADLLAREGRRAFEDWMEEAVRPDVALVTGELDLAHRTDLRPAIHPVRDHPGHRHPRPDRACPRARLPDRVPPLRSATSCRWGPRSSRSTVRRLPSAASRRLSGMVALGAERTIEQDPAFACRVMVDIAIRALSPAVNDPTTAVQVLDYLEETLRVVGATARPQDGRQPRPSASGVIMPVRTWPDFLALGVTEIRDYGATSIQVTRRLRALLEELGELVLPENRAAVAEELRRLDATVRAAQGGQHRPRPGAGSGPPGDRRPRSRAGGSG